MTRKGCSICVPSAGPSQWSMSVRDVITVCDTDRTVLNSCSTSDLRYLSLRSRTSHNSCDLRNPICTTPKNVGIQEILSSLRLSKTRITFFVECLSYKLQKSKQPTQEYQAYDWDPMKSFCSLANWHVSHFRVSGYLTQSCPFTVLHNTIALHVPTTESFSVDSSLLPLIESMPFLMWFIFFWFFAWLRLEKHYRGVYNTNFTWGT